MQPLQLDGNEVYLQLVKVHCVGWSKMRLIFTLIGGASFARRLLCLRVWWYGVCVCTRGSRVSSQVCAAIARVVCYDLCYFNLRDRCTSLKNCHSSWLCCTSKTCNLVCPTSATLYIQQVMMRTPHLRANQHTRPRNSQLESHTS